MENEIQQNLYCPNGHENPLENSVCVECGLPIVEWEKELNSLLGRMDAKIDFVVPHIRGSYLGLGTVGNEIVTNLCNNFGEDMPGVSFLNIDSMKSTRDKTAEEATSRGVRFYQHSIGDTSAGGSIYCGLGERAVMQDDQIESYLHMSGIRNEDTSQTVFVAAAVGGGTGSGAAPTIVNLCRLCNQEVSTIAMIISPSRHEADHSHLNAFYGISKLLTFNGKANADTVLMLNHDKLRHIRGVGRQGKEYKAAEVASYLLKLFQLNLQRSGMVRMCRLNRGTKIQAFVPCVAIGRSMEIFGNLANVMESAAAYPLAEIDFNNVIASYLLIRIPKAIANMYPDEAVSEEFEAWNNRYIPNMSSSLVQILHTDERSDRIDVCIMLGGANAGEIMADTVTGYRRFKASVTNPNQWEEYGLSEQQIREAEQVMENYDRSMEGLRNRNATDWSNTDSQD